MSCTNHRRGLSIQLNNLAEHIRQADGRYELPRLVELLERPEFDALKQVLAASGVGVEELQAAIDGIVEEVGQGSEGRGLREDPPRKEVE